jgi:hypothetical protein
MRITRMVFTLMMLMWLTAAAHGQQFKCEGAACKDVTLWFENGCHQAKNNGSRKINIKRGAFGKLLKPGETWQVRNLDGACLSVFIGGTTAEYAE